MPASDTTHTPMPLTPDLLSWHFNEQLGIISHEPNQWCDICYRWMELYTHECLKNELHLEIEALTTKIDAHLEWIQQLRDLEQLETFNTPALQSNQVLSILTALSNTLTEQSLTPPSLLTHMQPLEDATPLSYHQPLEGAASSKEVSSKVGTDVAKGKTEAPPKLNKPAPKKTLPAPSAPHPTPNLTEALVAMAACPPASSVCEVAWVIALPATLHGMVWDPTHPQPQPSGSH
jgi:hypothetical protein